MLDMSTQPTLLHFFDGGHDVVPGVLLVALPLQPLVGDIVCDPALVEAVLFRVRGVALVVQAPHVSRLKI